jgi:hypothetical protein
MVMLETVTCSPLFRWFNHGMWITAIYCDISASLGKLQNHITTHFSFIFKTQVYTEDNIIYLILICLCLSTSRYLFLRSTSCPIKSSRFLSSGILLEKSSLSLPPQMYSENKGHAYLAFNLKVSERWVMHTFGKLHFNNSS